MNFLHIIQLIKVSIQQQIQLNDEVILTGTHNLYFEQKYEKYQNFYLKTFSFWRWNFQYIWIGVFS